MKHIKRTLALLLAVVLVLALSISAFAVDTNGSIKVDNAVVNKTYTLTAFSIWTATTQTTLQSTTRSAQNGQTSS